MGANKVVQKSKEAKMKAAMAGGKGKKKKWSKGKVKEKLANLVMFDKATYDKMLKEIPKAKLITPSVVSERLKVNGSVARVAIRHLEEKGLIQSVCEKSSKQMIYTRKLDGRECALVIRGLGRVTSWAAALAAFSKMRGKGLQLDLLAFTAAMGACRRSARWALALTLFLDSRQLGFEQHERTVASNAACSAVADCEVGGWPRALQMLQDLLPRPGPSSGAGASSASVDGPAKAMADEVSFGVVVKACSRGSEWRSALQLLRDMRRLHLRPGLVPLSTAASTCSRSEHFHVWPWALRLLCLAREDGQTPDLVLYNCAIAAASKGARASLPGSWSATFALLRRLRIASVRPDTVSFNSACAACQRAEEADK
ncbi:unnamed protein product, partial [Polarella glacialis]